MFACAESVGSTRLCCGLTVVKQDQCIILSLASWLLKAYHMVFFCVRLVND